MILTNFEDYEVEYTVYMAHVHDFANATDEYVSREYTCRIPVQLDFDAKTTAPLFKPLPGYYVDGGDLKSIAIDMNGYFAYLTYELIVQRTRPEVWFPATHGLLRNHRDPTIKGKGVYINLVNEDEIYGRVHEIEDSCHSVFTYFSEECWIRLREFGVSNHSSHNYYDPPYRFLVKVIPGEDLTWFNKIATESKEYGYLFEDKRIEKTVDEEFVLKNGSFVLRDFVSTLPDLEAIERQFILENY